MISEPVHIEPRPLSDPSHTQYRPLSDLEKHYVAEIKRVAAELYKLVQTIDPKGQPTRECSLARTKLEECVMWAVKGITK